MSDALKAALAGLVVAIIAILGVVMNDYLVMPGPLPSPSPSPSVSPSPSPTPTPTDPPLADIVLRGSRNEVLGTRINLDVSACQPILHDSEIFTPEFFRIGSETTTHKSYNGAALGDYENALYPITQVCANDHVWMDVKIPVTLTPGDYTFIVTGTTVSIRVWSMTMPNTFAMPAYSAISTWGILQSHMGNPPDGGDWSAEWRIGERYVQIAIDHGFYPFGFTPSNRVSNTTDLARMIQYSPGWLWIPIRAPRTNQGDPGFDWSVASLQAGEAVSFPREKVIYPYDEPRGLGNVTTSDMQASITTIKQNAPSLSVFITMNYESQIATDIWSPVFEYYPINPDNPGIPFPSMSRTCGYVSCMTSGCAENGNLTGTPGFEVELPPVYRRSITWIAHHLGMECFLYYHMNVEFGNRLNGNGYSLWHDEGGNGDGQIFGPPDLENHLPVVTLRMKEWREAAYDYQYLLWEHTDVSSLITSTRVWDKDYSKYQTIRDQIGERLSQ